MMDMRVKAAIPGLYSDVSGLIFLVLCDLGCIWGLVQMSSRALCFLTTRRYLPKVHALHVSIASFPYGGSSVIRKRAMCKR
jgi:hypothetical protein